MSYNGSGLFQINTSGQPVVAGTVITASAFNALTADLATGLTTAITKDGQTATTAQIPFAQGLRSTLVTDSTTSTSGSIITDGGLGVAKAVNIGTTLGVTGAVTGSSTITGTKLIPTGTSVTGNGMYLPATNSVGISTAGVNAVYIDASQNVGMGVTPSAWSVSGILQIGRTALSGVANAVGSSLSWNAYYNAGWKYYDSLQASQYTQSNGVHTWSTAASGTAGNAISFTQAMTLDASGNLLVGTTTAIQSTRYSFSSASGRIMGIEDVAGGSGTQAIRFVSAGNNCGIISTSTTTTTYGTSSDYRLKKNVAPMTGALSVVQQLKPCTYTWKLNGSDGQGFIAHELQAVVPDCVTGEKDAIDEDGNPVYQGIDTSFLVATLTAAIQELKAELDTAKEQIAALQGAAK